MKENPKIAILIFSRTSHQEAKHKQFAAQNYQTINKVVAQKLINQVKEVTAQLKTDVIFWNSHHQQGNSFQERFYHAFCTAFSSGYQKVIAVGNDCPELKLTDLILAKNNLFYHDFVLGPAEDGGVYLLGIDHKVFSNEFFNVVNWHTPSVFSDIINYITLTGKTYFLLKEKRDIDNYLDLIRITRSKKLPPSLSTILNELISCHHNFFINTKSNLISSINTSNNQLRAPPVFF